MESQLVTAVTPFRFLDLPREVRDDIYEAAIFDLSAPDMFMKPQDPDSLRLRKLDTNVLLTSSQVYWEARDVIVRRGQLIMVSFKHRNVFHFEKLLKALSGVTGIDPMYRNLCVMKHRIDGPTSPFQLFYPSYEIAENWEFILHRYDSEFFCHVIMGEFDRFIGQNFGTRATHTLSLHWFPTYGQHELSTVFATQTLVLQTYRHNIRNLEHTFIRGPSIGWESGLYGAVVQDIRSIDDREPTDLIDDIRALEQKGSRILLQTGDVEASDVVWAKAIARCHVVYLSFRSSIEPVTLEYDVPKAFETHVQRWTQLRRQYSDGCAVLFLELWHKLIRHRLSGALRFFEQGHHLATRHGRSPRPTDDYLYFVFTYSSDLKFIDDMFERGRWPAKQADEAQLCVTGAAIIRVLDATDRVQEAYKAVLRASELAPDDESIQQEKDRVETWIRRLVDDRTLGYFPSSESLADPWWRTLTMDVEIEIPLGADSSIQETEYEG